MLPLLGLHLHGLIELIWVDFFEDSLESNERLSEDLMPVVLCELDDNGHEHWEGLLLVRLEDVEEVVVLEEAHGAVSNLQVVTANGLDDTFK